MSEEKPKYLGTWKGRVIKAIAIDGARTFNEIRENTGLYYNTLKKVLAELHHTDSIEYNKETKKYWVIHKLYKEYEEYFQEEGKKRTIAPVVKITPEAQEEFSRWIDVWKDNKEGVDLNLQHKHFYLEGTHLVDFSKDLISKATAEVLVVNPFIETSHIADSLRIPAKKENVAVSIIVREPKEKDKEKEEKKREYHRILKNTGIRVYYNEGVHSKLIVVDRAVAIVSSMNFTVYSSGGQSWEGGMISTEPKVANMVVDSILNRIEVQETIEMD